jgi:hypothetical protein
MPRHPFRRYLALTGFTILGLTVVSIALCVYVDPYRMYATDRIARKPFVYSQADLAKAYMLERMRPNTLILGNSRVEAGLDPESEDWPDNRRPVFNAAGARVDVFMAWRLLQHDIAIKPPQLVVLGLDFPDFVARAATGRSEPPRASEARLLVGRDGRPNPGRGLQLWKDFFTTTLTRRAIADSIATLYLRNRAAEPTMTRAGFNPAPDYGVLLHRSGSEAIFSHYDAIYRARYRASAVSYFYTPLRNVQFRALANIVKLAKQYDIRLIVFIPPYHSRYLEILHETGFWSSFEAWKRALVETVDDAAGNRRDLVLLYDFSDYDDISGERVPQPGDTQAEMRWYRDSAHYTRALGDLMIATLTGAGPVLGQELNDDTLQADLQRIRDDRDRLFAPAALQLGSADN